MKPIGKKKRRTGPNLHSEGKVAAALVVKKSSASLRGWTAVDDSEPDWGNPPASTKESKYGDWGDDELTPNGCPAVGGQEYAWDEYA